MVHCPFCGHENIDGEDSCQQCQQPLEFLSSPQHTGLERSLLKDRVFALAPRQPITVAPDTPVRDVLDMLVAHSIGCVVIADGDEPVGIFSERDALHRLNVDAAAMEDAPISEFMTANPETVESDARIAFALHKMDIGGYRHMPVVSEGRVVGVISIRDVLDYITANLLATSD
ncbi:MAG TPA: CBS domain-containing protein [Pirellulales bacterium]